MTGLPGQLGFGFHGARFGSLADLDLDACRTAFRALEEFSDRYLAAAHAAGVWPASYPWPTDALHCNTRAWEYPYVLDALLRFGASSGRVLDIGSALTFLPAFMASLGYTVVASDADPRMKTWASQIWRSLRVEPLWPDESKLAYETCDVVDLGAFSSSFDVVTNVSVLEHLDGRRLAEAVESIHRVLRPGGLLISTLDCLIRGERATRDHRPLDQGEFASFVDTLQRHFLPAEEVAIRLPCDLLTNLSARLHCRESRYGHPVRSRPPSIRTRLRAAARVLWGKQGRQPLEWCVFGVTVRKP